MESKDLSKDNFFWALQGICALHRKPFSIELGHQQLAAPYTVDSFTRAAHAYGFDATLGKCKVSKLYKESFPLVVWLTPKASAVPDSDGAAAQRPAVTPALLLQADSANVLVVEPGDATPATISLSEFSSRYCGRIARIIPQGNPGTDPDSEAEARQSRKFGFSWFIPELLNHKKLWQEVLIASFVIQLIALATPLFSLA
ncbi:MAG: peptidase transporter, partial [Burkholderia sp.]|nr:peptidase transporter [Burkholderia sp.]